MQSIVNRHITQELFAYLDLMPVVFVAGARQSGKTTLMEGVRTKRNFSFYTLDDDFSLMNATRDPSGWLATLPKPVIIDEVQRAPEIFLSIKRDVDEHRHPGRYLLTGSANPMLLPKLGDSLAGRMGILSMFPFSQGELRGVKESFLFSIFGPQIYVRNLPSTSLQELQQTLLRGGFPPVQQTTPEDTGRWIRSYLQAMIERDVRDLAHIEGIREFPRLLQLLATRTAQLLNIADLSRSLGMVNVTVNRYLRLLEALFFIHLVPAWFTNLGKRIIKSPKIHFFDTAVLTQLLGVNLERVQRDPYLAGQLLETFVFTELKKQKSWAPFPFEIFHFRDGNYEVDFVLETPDKTIIGIEVKSSHALQNNDLKGLKHLQTLAQGNFKRGIILHPGNRIESLGKDLWALPISALWQPF